MNFFHKKNPNLKKKIKILFFGGRRGLGGMTGEGRGGGGEVDGWTEEQFQTNLPLQLSKFGA